MQQDYLSLPAVEDLPLLAAALDPGGTPQLAAARKVRVFGCQLPASQYSIISEAHCCQGWHLGICCSTPYHLLQHTLPRLTSRRRKALVEWDAVAAVLSVGTTVYRCLMTEWCLRVARARFSAEAAPFLVGLEPLARRLLAEDAVGWFPTDAARLAALNESFRVAVEGIVERLGPEPAGWPWGQLHIMPLRHVLSALGDGSISLLLDHGGRPVGGDMRFEKHRPRSTARVVQLA